MAFPEGEGMMADVPPLFPFALFAGSAADVDAGAGTDVVVDGDEDEEEEEEDEEEEEGSDPTFLFNDSLLP